MKKTKDKKNKNNRVIKLYIISLLSSFLVCAIIGALFLAFGKNPAAALAAIEKGNEAYSIGDYSKAYSEYKKAMFFDKTNREAILGTANSLSALGKDEDAASLVTKGISNYPGYYGFYSFLVGNYVKTFKTEQALDFISNIKSTAVLMNLKDQRPQSVRSNPAAGSYNRSLEVSLFSDEKSSIYYTTDGTIPTIKSEKYDPKKPIKITSGKNTITAISVTDKYMISEKVVLSFNIFSDDESYIFEDSKIETMVRLELQKPIGQPILYKDIVKINNLSCYDKNGRRLDGVIRSLKDISAMNSITSLVLVGEPTISDYTVLNSATTLKNLTIDNCALTDSKLSEIGAIKWLQTLNISNNQLTSLANIGSLEALTLLIASSNRIVNLDGLSGMKNLTEITLDNNKIIDVSALARVSALKKLNLASNNLSSINSLLLLSNLEELDISKNNLSDLTGLNALTNLKKLNIAMNSISSFNFLRNISKLESLDMSGIFIEDLSFIDNSNIKKLVLVDCGISSIYPLSRVLALEILDVRNSSSSSRYKNDIVDISPLSRLTKLNTLYVDNNENLINIELLNDLSSLKYIYCQGCKNINKATITNPNIKIN